jgi:hypothetical protein
LIAALLALKTFQNSGVVKQQTQIPDPAM